MKHGYSIRDVWIGPVEGTEYRVAYTGFPEILAFRKSARAAFNFIKKHIEKQSRPINEKIKEKRTENS